MKYAVIAAAVFSGDFFLKKHMDETRELNKKTEICKGKLALQKYYNDGAALNFMGNRPQGLKIFSGCLLIFIGILWFLAVRKKENPGIIIGLSLLLGGGASNFYDRVTKGHVIDYFSFRTPWKWLNQIVFNISDMFVFVGSLLVFIFNRE